MIQNIITISTEKIISLKKIINLNSIIEDN